MQAPGGLEAIACLRELPAQGQSRCSSLPLLTILVGMTILGLVAALRWRRRTTRRGPTRSVEEDRLHWWTHQWSRLRIRSEEYRGQMGQAWKLIRGTERSAFRRTLPLSLIQWIARYSIATLILQAFGCPIDPLVGIGLQWMTFAAMAFFPSPGAIGGAEGAFYAVYSGIVPAAALGAALISWRVLTFYVPMLLASAGTLGIEGWSSARRRQSRASVWGWDSTDRTAREEV
jgi:uncharacterized protein (TIRG00374 family)